jgi:hypothetical protein
MITTGTFREQLAAALLRDAVESCTETHTHRNCKTLEEWRKDIWTNLASCAVGQADALITALSSKPAVSKPTPCIISHTKQNEASFRVVTMSGESGIPICKVCGTFWPPQPPTLADGD